MSKQSAKRIQSKKDAKGLKKVLIIMAIIYIVIGVPFLLIHN